VLGDPWPEEPDDPYPDPGDPDSFSFEVPDGSGVSSELYRAFWGLVAVFNVGLFATALGLLLVAFRGAYALGGVVLAIGLVSLVYGVRRYRRYRLTGAVERAESPDGA